MNSASMRIEGIARRAVHAGSLGEQLTPHPPAGRSRDCLRLPGFPSAGEGPSRDTLSPRERAFRSTLSKLVQLHLSSFNSTSAKCKNSTRRL
jgi:hypothetical protein